jgi:hypothetical protein
MMYGKSGDGNEMKKGMAKGGMPMVNKDGKKVPAFAADGIGKMAKGGMTKKAMAYGGMTKKGMAKGGMANCGASMKPAQGKGK